MNALINGQIRLIGNEINQSENLARYRNFLSFKFSFILIGCHQMTSHTAALKIGSLTHDSSVVR